MEVVSRNLKLAGIINIIIGIVSISGYFMMYGLFMIVTGAVLYIFSQQQYEELLSNKVFLIVLAIILLLPNTISAILILLATDKIEELRSRNFHAPPSKTKKKKEEIIIDPEVKKIDILLKLGVAMVFISGILFATTSWEFITNPIKALVLILIGTLFLGLSKFSEKKLKLEKTTFMYWILSMSFYLLTWVGIGYFGLIGKWFTYQGAGSDLVYMITFLLLSTLSYLTYRKFKKSEILYIVYGGLLISIYNLLSFINLTEIIKIVIINIILFLPILFTNKESKIYEFSKTITYIIFIGILLNITSENPIIVLITSIINIVSLFYISYKTNNQEENILILIINYILLIASICNLDINSYHSTIIMLILSLETLLIRFKIISKNNKLDIVNQVLFSIASLMMYVVAASSSTEEMCIVSNIFLIINFIGAYNWHKDNSNKIFYFLQPVSIMFVILSGALYFDEHLFEVTFAGFSLILSVAYCFMNLFTNEKALKREYFVFLILLTILGTMVNLLEADFLLSITTIITPVYIFCYNYFFHKEQQSFLIASYIFLLFNIFLSIATNQIITESILINNLIVIWIYVVLIYLLRKEYVLTKITNIALVIPMFNIIEYTNFSWTIQTILRSILQFYVLYLILNYFCKDKNAKTITGIIGLIIILAQILFIEGLLMGIYVGVVGIIITMIGFYKKDYNYFFPAGLIIIIVNIIYQLLDLWEKIPFWLYLLVGGLGIIGFVTYKETKKINKK